MSRRSGVRAASWITGLASLALFLLSHRLGFGPPVVELLRQTGFLLPYALAVTAALLAAKRSADAERRFWSLLGVASALIFASELLVSIQTVLGGIQLRADATMAVLTLGAAAVFFTLLVTMTRLRVPPGPTRVRYVVDASLVGVMTLLLSLELGVDPLFSAHASIPRLDRLLAAAFPVIAVVVLGGTLANLFSLRARRFRQWERLVAAGIAVFALALASWPVWYVSKTVTGSPFGVAVEAMWSLGYHLVFVGAVYRLTSAEERWDVTSAAIVRPILGSWGDSVVLGVGAVLTMLVMHVRPAGGDAHTLSAPEADVLAAVLGGLFVSRTILMALENRKLRASATVDPITGLANHRSFHDCLAGELSIAARFGEQVSVAFLDLDAFGVVNDLMGHPEGDKMLRTVGEVLEGHAPEGSTVCRVGGDEFAVVMPATGGAAAASACQAMRRALSRIVCPALPKVKASFGIASYPGHATLREDLVRLAEGAQYWAKLHGKDQVVLYDPEVVQVLGPEDHIGLMQRAHVLGTMQALAAAVDARDPGTRFHSRTVAGLAVRLAEDMGFDPDRIRLLEAAAILHDVGKIGVSDSVLRKPGPLTASERRQVEEHPLLADRILSATPLSEVVPWVVAHHERWDGGGYPQGLPGDEIPLEARILAVCDAYDAMVSDRPYRSALSVEAALQEIDLNMGTQFDPEVAERFIRIVQADQDEQEARPA